MYCSGHIVYTRLREVSISQKKMSILFKPQAPSLKFAKHVHGTGVIHQFCIYPDAQLKKNRKQPLTA